MSVEAYAKYGCQRKLGDTVNRLPNEKLAAVLKPAFAPCSHFGQCPEAIWDPVNGHIPRGFLGAVGPIEKVKLTMVFAEPGHPLESETYPLSSSKYIEEVTWQTYQRFSNQATLMHQNVRWILDQAFPRLSFDEQLELVWLANARMCSIDDEIGSTPDIICTKRYLARILALLLNSRVIAFGGKAQHKLRRAGIPFVAALSVSPPGCKRKHARPSWLAALVSSGLLEA
jgi:hypothetical protein